jgi:hypothetical protein
LEPKDIVIFLLEILDVLELEFGESLELEAWSLELWV